VGRVLVESALMITPLMLNNLLPPSGERTAGPAVAHAMQVMDVERLLGLDVEPALTGFLGAHRALFDGALTYYSVMHFAVTAAAAVILALVRPQLWARMRTTFVAGSLAALVVSRLWPLAPPNLLTGAGFDAVAAASHPPNPYAAMPSLHTAWALWSVLALILAARPYDRRLRALAAAAGGTHLGVIVLIVLSTGHHFVLDVLGGVGVVALGAGVAAAQRRRGSAPGRWSVRWPRRRQACSASAISP
jgi:hypothetical protein